MYLIVLCRKSIEEKQILKPPFPLSMYAGCELLLLTFILAVAGTFVVLGKGCLLVRDSSFSNQHNGKTILC